MPDTSHTCNDIATLESLNKTSFFTLGDSFFGRRVKVLFDDKKEYLGMICGRDTQTNEWITKFEDGTEDRVSDPVGDRDYTLL